MTAPEYNPDDSQARRRDRSWTGNPYDVPTPRQEFVQLAERVAALERQQRTNEKYVSEQLEAIERRMKEDLQEMNSSLKRDLDRIEKSAASLDKTTQAINITLAEIKVKSGLIGVLASGITFFLLMAAEWIKSKSLVP